MAHPFVRVELNTSDVAKANEFYQKLFEWKLQDVPSSTWVARLLRLSGKRSSGAARSLGFEPQLVDVRTFEDLGPAFDGAVSVPTRSSWALTLFHRRTSGSSLTWPPSIGWRQSMHPWCSSGA